MIDVFKLAEARPDDLKELVELYADLFAAWKRKTPYRQSQAVSAAFPVFWVLRGPTNFTSTEGSQAFKAMVQSVCESRATAAVDETVTEPSE